MQQALQLEKKQPKWKARDFKHLQILKNEVDAIKLTSRNVLLYRLSIPFFSANGKFMAVHVKGSTASFSFTTEYLLVYELVNDNWVQIEMIPF